MLRSLAPLLRPSLQLLPCPGVVNVVAYAQFNRSYATATKKNKGSKPSPKPSPKSSPKFSPKSSSKSSPKSSPKALPTKGSSVQATQQTKSQQGIVGSNKQSPPAPVKAVPAGTPIIQFKKRKSRKALTNTMAMAAKAHARQQRRKLGDRSLAPSTAREEVLAEMYEEVEGSTIHITKEEFGADPTTLNFDQLYRRILRTFEDKAVPKKALLFEMLKRSKSQEDWDNFVIIAKVYQSKLILMKPKEASHLVHIAINQGFLNQLYDEMQKNILFVYPTKAGYHKIIMELMKANQLDKILKTLKAMAERDVQPYRESFKQLIQHYNNTDVDSALKLFKISSALGVRTTSVEAYIIARKLAEAERWADIVEVETIAKKDNPQNSFRKLISLIFVNARHKAGDEAGAKQLVQEQQANLTEDLASLSEADKSLPFIASFQSTFPQLSQAS